MNLITKIVRAKDTLENRLIRLREQSARTLGRPETEAIVRSVFNMPEDDHDPELLATCRAVYDGLCEMTTEQFRRGEDRPLRVMLAAVLVKAGEVVEV